MKKFVLRVRAAIQRILTAIAEYRFDFVGIVGFTLFVAGIARLSISAAMIVAGALLFYFAYVMTPKPTR